MFTSATISTDGWSGVKKMCVGAAALVVRLAVITRGFWVGLGWLHAHDGESVAFESGAGEGFGE